MSSLVCNQLVLPEVQTIMAKTSAQARVAPQLLQRPHTTGGMFRYAHIYLYQGVLDLDGNSYATNRRHANLALSLNPGRRRCGELPQPHAEEGG